MALLLKLQLNIEGDVTSTNNNNNNDSLMQKIAHSPGSTTARKSVCGCCNNSFIKHFIHMLSFNFTFNEFHPRETLPRNIDSAVLTASMPILAHNQKVLVKYLKSLVEEDDPVSHQLREIFVQEQLFVILSCSNDMISTGR